MSPALKPAAWKMRGMRSAHTVAACGSFGSFCASTTLSGSPPGAVCECQWPPASRARGPRHEPASSHARTASTSFCCTAVMRAASVAGVTPDGTQVALNEPFSSAVGAALRCAAWARGPRRLPPPAILWLDHQTKYPTLDVPITGRRAFGGNSMSARAGPAWRSVLVVATGLHCAPATPTPSALRSLWDACADPSGERCARAGGSAPRTDAHVRRVQRPCGGAVAATLLVRASFSTLQVDASRLCRGAGPVGRAIVVRGARGLHLRVRRLAGQRDHVPHRAPPGAHAT